MVLIVTIFFSCKKEKLVAEECSTPTVAPCNIFSFKMNGTSCALDQASNTFFYSIKNLELEFSPLIEITHEDLQIFINENPIDNFEINDLGLINVTEPLPIKFIRCDGTELEYQLIFTRLPLIQINTNGQQILDDPKIAADFQLNDPDYLENGNLESTFNSISGIELRGGSAQNHPKKSYAIELWSNNFGTENIDSSLLGMRKDDDWILDAMFIDKARMRNRVSTDIWLDFYQLHYQSLEPKAKSGTHGKFVEFFINDSYNGIYVLSERVDRKLLKLKKLEDGDDHGLLYKSIHWQNGVVWFENYFDFDPNSDYWQGWDQKYPDPETEKIIWEPLANFTQFVVESSDDEFINQIANQIYLNNAVDYFIFINLLRASDNTGKNVFMVKYNQADRFMMLPWDLDGTWGRAWNGNSTNASSILSNNLFDRLIENDVDGFKNKLKQRWTVSRNNIFTVDNIMSYFEKYADAMEATKAFEREKSKWELTNTLTGELNYTQGWIEDRLDYLDNYFDTL